MANRLRRLMAVPLALLAPLLGACSELMPPSPEIQAQVVVSQGTVQVDNPGDYFVGTVQVRGVNLNGSVSAVATLKDPPPGVRLVSPGTITVTSQSQGHDLKLNLDPSKLFLSNETKKNLKLTLLLTAQGLSSARASFDLTVERSGGGTGNPPPTPSLSLQVSMAQSSAQPGSTLQGTFILQSHGGAEGLAFVIVEPCPQARATYNSGPYRLLKDGKVERPFTVEISRDASPGTCQVKVNAYLYFNNQTLSAEATTSFTILPPTPNPSLSLEARMEEPLAERGAVLKGTFILRSQGGAEGSAFVVVEPCPQARATYNSGPYRLPKDDGVPHPFEVHIPRDASPGTCQVKVKAYLGNLTAEATTSFTILPGGSTLELQVGSGSIVEGTSAVLLPFELFPLNGWTGLVEIRLLRKDDQKLVEVTRWKVQDAEGKDLVVPDSSGTAYHFLNATLKGRLRLEGLETLAPGTYTYYVRANDLTRSFTLTVSP